MESLVAAGQAALGVGHWAAARSSFETALEVLEIPEAWYGLGEALSWLGDLQGTMTSFERAYAVFRRQGDPDGAAAVALRIGFHSMAHLANPRAASRWIGRARRLVDAHALDDLRGEVLLLQACNAPDAAIAEQDTRDALDLACRAGDSDLELCALSWLGVSMVEQGRVEEGLPLLDEAIAGSLAGEAGRLDTVVFTTCNMMISCARCAAFERATQWVRATERFARRYGCPFLYAKCRTIHGAVLMATGEWDAAEQELGDAIELSRCSAPTSFPQAAATLAELRLAQGRLEEAERLLSGLEGDEAVVPVLARFHLAAGRPAQAAAEVRHSLDTGGASRLESVLLLELLGEAELALGDRDGATMRGHHLAALGKSGGCAIALARGERLQGRALTRRAAGRARRHLEASLSEFIRLRMPFEAARTRLALAQTLGRLEPGIAMRDARAALVSFETLGAHRDADAAAAVLRDLGGKATRTGPGKLRQLTRREREVLARLGEGLSNPEIAERLFISRKTVEHHVSRILSKLAFRGRVEAAVEAVSLLGRESAGTPEE